MRVIFKEYESITRVSRWMHNTPFEADVLLAQLQMQAAV